MLRIGKVYLITGILALLMIAALHLYSDRPEYNLRWEIQGQFDSAYHGGGRVGGGDKYARWAFVVLIPPEEHFRIEAENEAKGGWWAVSTSYDSSWEMAHAKAQSRGPWCGELPPQGTPVRIKSPTGHTRHVSITDLNTGRIYKSANPCSRPMLTFVFRVYDRSTGQIVSEGTRQGLDWYEAMNSLLSSYSTEDSPYLLQFWQEGEPAPAPYSPH